MNNLAIIPARGGSKRIPRKNIKFFLGKPIIAYSIEAAINSGLFTEIMVSTDDEEIAEVAKRYGAKVPFIRSCENADDFATTADVLTEVIESYQQREMSFQYTCCIYPTAPFVNDDYLQRGYKLLVQENKKSVFPVSPFSYPIWRGLQFDVKGRVHPVWPKHQQARSQDLQEVYHDAGQWYWFHTEFFLQARQLYTDNSGSIILNPLEVQDIDNIHDWKIAELKYEYLQNLR